MPPRAPRPGDPCFDTNELQGTSIDKCILLPIELAPIAVFALVPAIGDIAARFLQNLHGAGKCAFIGNHHHPAKVKNKPYRQDISIEVVLKNDCQMACRWWHCLLACPAFSGGFLLIL